jgi:SAM-dependent MidA family methyltransferase
MSEYQAGDGSVADRPVAVQAQEKVQQTAQQASQKSAEYLRQQAETRAGQVSEELQSVADALRRSGHALHADGKQTSATAVDNVTQTVERLSRYLGESNGDQMLRDLESFGRRKPWGMIGIGLGLGVVASRFLKASSQTRYQSTPQVSPSTLQAPALPVSVGEPVTQVGHPAYQGR